MPQQSGKSDLAGKLGSKARKAFAKHRTDDTSYGAGGDLPDGIDGGIAQLVECKFAQYKTGDNAGEYFFYAGGVVVEPTEFANIRIEGLRTSIMEPVCETPNRSRPTTEEHMEWISNELRKLGLDTSTVEPEDLESAIETLKEQQPYFRFRTWKGEATKEWPNPRVNHQWNGSCEYASESVESVVDETKDDDSDEDDSPRGTAAEGTVAERADSGDEEAQAQLTVQAEETGLDPEDYESWGQVADAIVEAEVKGLDSKDDDDNDNDAKEEIKPEKGEVYSYKPPKKRKLVECEVTAVFTGKETCNLKNLDDGKSYKSVPWSDLVSE